MTGRTSAAMGSRKAGLRNEQIVLALLKQHGELSQAQLCKLAGLSSSTASYIVGRLREKGLILEREGESKRRGARPTIVSIRPDGRFAVGAEITPSEVCLGLFNFCGELIDELRAPLGESHAPEHVVRVLEINLRGLLSRHGISDDKVVGVGVTLSGSLSRAGVVELSAPLGWKDVPLEASIQRVFPSVPIQLYTTRVRLLAEMMTNGMSEAKNVVLLNVANGVGASVVVDGRLLHGASNRSGELGHVVFSPGGELCGCGHRGCLETLISGPALKRRIKKDIAEGRAPLLAGRVTDEHIPEQVVQLWGQAVSENDEYSLALRDEVASHASEGAAIAINCYDPEILVLAGYVVETIFDFVLEAIQKRIQEAVYDNYARDIKIVPAQAGPQALIRGVAAAVLRRATPAL